MKYESFNIFGFDRHKIDNTTYRYCSIHSYKRLIESKTDPTLLFCPECGSEFKIEDTVAEEKISSMFGPGSSKPTIIQGKKKKRYFDDSGNEINDQTLINDIQRAVHVIRYHEEKSGEERVSVKRK